MKGLRIVAALLCAASLPAQDPELDILDRNGVKVGVAMQSAWAGNLSFYPGWDYVAAPAVGSARVVLLFGVKRPTGPFIEWIAATDWRYAKYVVSGPRWFWTFTFHGTTPLPRGADLWIQPVWIDNVHVGWDRPVVVKG